MNIDFLLDLLPSAGTIALVVLLLVLADRFLDRAATNGRGFRNQIIMLLLTAAGTLLIIMVVPMGDAMRGQLLGLIGIVLSAAIALSSTTLLGNALAGLMLRSIRSFYVGDFIRTGEYFGRVTERDLFHTEIQTEDRELTTLPNLYLVTNPVTTIRSSGTILSTRVSLGYDVPRTRIEELLLAGAGKAELEDPFVQILELGDFSVTYRVAGLLKDVKRLLSSKSRLRACVLDALHLGGVEIVSPTFMNQRQVGADRRFIPKVHRDSEPSGPAPEDLVFDKAEEAAAVDAMGREVAEVKAKIEALQGEMKAAEDPAERARVEQEIATLEARKAEVEAVMAERQARFEGPGGAPPEAAVSQGSSSRSVSDDKE